MFTPGMANSLSWAYWSRSRKDSPVTTPGLTEAGSFTSALVASARRATPEVVARARTLERGANAVAPAMARARTTAEKKVRMVESAVVQFTNIRKEGRRVKHKSPKPVGFEQCKNIR